MKISVITPSVRPEGLDIVQKSLDNQTFREFEWIIVGPVSLVNSYRGMISDFYKRAGYGVSLLHEPPKNEGDMYNLNKAWNKAFKEARGELFVSFVDMTWAPPNALQQFWDHYEANPKGLIGGVGNQFAEVIDGRPEIQIWKDPRMRMDYGSFYEINPIDLEFCLTSVPKQAIIDCGGLDEDYDKVAALSEKDMCIRLDMLGYKFYLDQSIEYRALTHPRLTTDWEERYQAGCRLFDEKIAGLRNGSRSPKV